MPKNAHFIHNGHYLSLSRKIGVIYKSKYYSSLGSFLFFSKKLTNENRYIETLCFIRKCVEMGIFKIEILRSYYKFHLLFPGEDPYLTTCISSYLQLYFTDYNLIRGSNKLHDLFKIIIEEHM